jgi:CRISPR-associated endonuclease Csn1
MDKNYHLDQDDQNDIQNKLKDVFGHRTWDNMLDEEKKEAINIVSNKYLNFLQKTIYSKNVFEKTERLHDQIFDWLKETYQINDDRIKYLWHPSEQETYKQAEIIDNFKLLGSPEPISKGFKNPMALKTLHRLKQLINYLIKIGKIDEDTRVVIEIARELNDANMRRAIQRYQREKENENQKYREQIIEINNSSNTNYNPDDKNLIDKFRLWIEQKNICIYTGKQIKLSDVLDGSKYDFEHTVPASMSFDNEMKNLTLADKTYNQQIKGKKLPSECPNYETEATINGVIYPSILRTLEVIFGELVEVIKKGKNKKIEKRWQFSRIIELENKLAIERNKSSDVKEIKDNIIVNRHLAKMHLDYWRNKLNAFLIKEHKAGFRNSQLRDTQIITKYALPYMKTVFKKVEVQKGSVTATFRKIYKINDAENPKSRERHTHHAIDAAILTLIPPPAKRDSLLKKYNEALDNNQKTYHELPFNWKDFKTAHVLIINDETFINYMPDNRFLTKTYKNVRKRGRLQFVKEKTNDGKWQYKKDEQGNKIPLIANGDSIRGQLHKDSYYGAIQKDGDIVLVERYPISTFTSIKDCNNIIDNTIRELVRNTLNERMESGMTFDKAKLDPIPFHKGNEVIKKVRCKVAAGRGYLGTDKAIKINKHEALSKHEYKQHVYAQNDTNAFCLYYELISGEQTYRALRIIGLFELAQLKIKNPQQFKKEPHFNTITSGKGKKEIKIPLKAIIQNGTKCIFFEESKEELKDLPKADLMNRLFRVYKFNDKENSKVIHLMNHIEARKKDLLEKAAVNYDYKKYQALLALTSKNFTCIIENYDFKINIDGTIEWLF